MTVLIPAGKVVVATDKSMAYQIRTSGTEAQQAVDSRITGVAADIIASDPSIKAGAAAAALAANADAGVLFQQDMGAVRTIVSDHPVYSEVRLTFDYRQAGGVLREGGEVTSTPGTVASAIRTGEGSRLLSRDYRRIDTGGSGVTLGFSQLVGWGDSMTTDYATPGVTSIGQVAAELGVEAIDQGRAGDTPHEIAWRAGALAWRVTIPSGVLPASGEVAMTVDPGPGFYNSRVWSASLADVTGATVQVTLRCQSVSMGGTPSWTIEQVGGTTAKTILPGTRVKWERTLGLESLPCMVWMGRNDSNLAASVDRVAASLTAILSQHRDPLRRRIVLPVWNRDTEPSGSAGYVRVMEMNAKIREIAGDDFYDLRAAIIQNGLKIAGITPTSEDTAAIAADKIPPSLMADITHPNVAGKTAIGRLVGNELKARNW